jgi:hypothetical protein
MAEIASAFVSVAPDASGFGRKLDSSIGSEASKAGQKSGKLFGSAMKVAAGAALAGAAVVGTFLKGSLEEAREAQKVGALTASTIKATGGAANVTAKQVGNLAGAISMKTGIDDETIQSGQNMLLTFKNIRNEAGKGNDVFNQSTKTLVDMSAAMGSEPKQAAIQLGKALNDPVKGISALSRVGVTFTKSQQKVIEGFVKGGETAKAQKVILSELNSEFGGAAEAQATAGDRFKVAFGNLQESVGTALLPVIDKVLGGLTKLATYLSSNVGPKISTFLNQIKTGTGLGGQFRDAVSSVVTTVGQVVAFMVRWQDVLIPVAAGIMAIVVAVKIWRTLTMAMIAVQTALNVVLALNPIGIVVLAIIGLVAAFAVAYKRSETFRKIVDGAFRAVAAAGKWMWENVLRPAFDGMKAALEAVGDAGKWLWNNALQPTFRFIVKGIGTLLNFWGKMLQVIGKAPGMGWVGDLGDKLVGAAEKANGLADNIRDIPENKTVNLNVNEHWVTTRTVKKGGFGPQLASGGIITRPTLALVGEGRESEAVLPLSKLSALLDHERAASSGADRSTLHVYDRDNVLIGTMEAVADGRVHARRRHDKRMAAR